jgi:hypothetical protein
MRISFAGTCPLPPRRHQAGRPEHQRGGKGRGERDEMTINIESAGPALFSAAARQATRRAGEARRRQHVVTFVVLAAAARTAVDRRTLAGVIVLAFGLVAASRLAKERGTPGLDWYMRAGRSWLTDTLDSATGQEKPARSNPGSAPAEA